jgi:hypothetical protein
MDPVDAPAERRWGLLTGETALVLGLIGVIVAGTFLVDTIQPASERTNTIYGKTTMKVHNLGTGGIQPGAVQPRQSIPPQNLVSKPGEVPLEPPPPTPIPTKAVVTPVATPKPTTGAKTPPILPAPGTNPGGGGTKPCGLLGLGSCPQQTAPADTQPDPAVSATPTPATQTTSKTTKKKTAVKPTPTPTTTPAAR